MLSTQKVIEENMFFTKALKNFQKAVKGTFSNWYLKQFWNNIKNTEVGKKLVLSGYMKEAEGNGLGKAPDPESCWDHEADDA